MNAHENSVKALLEMYPQAIKATKENVELGDVICNHIKCGCLVVTKEMMSIPEQNYDFFYIVGKTGCTYQIVD
ncbi:hypothetical protein AB4455_06505 [Vibrio sp. 10N.261.46.E12]|uniref:hypothetical protein n=1 Tax=unclassified Vibrio TaxID=2614977 RepID=UPI0009756458|nr:MULTISPECIES: hypothetical protein [unclassified Vibrio]OMO37189.1 hypothetical protein BH584_23775 [Vibrio sp. 10N.261.45.E1]PMJ25778.1 hypothetical protein BCU27_09960 [Vibrio sp. 10N.286.45.B6]PML84427.1 hypothetical protein BCT66_17430 [Vibrio sp. 10N.261.49.E11]PMM90185.1 hypothetical protein BCT46_23755 [Vibrio sp. 10N.261.46.E8]PMN46148.1 hypothetical protein BCT32_11175 [Vibrio sp. 10N.261.45.E11]